MANLMLKVIEGSGYDDGDILCAFNSKKILCVNAYNICFEKTIDRKWANLNEKGLLPLTDLAKDFCENSYEYRFEAKNQFLGRIIRLSDKEVINFTSNKTFIDFKGNAVRMDIEKFIAKQIETLNQIGGNGRPIFGNNLSNITWYGGEINLNLDNINSIWNAIENKSENLRKNYNEWPAGKLEIKHHLMISVDDFDDTVANDLISPLMDDEDDTVVLKKRKNNIDWQNTMNLSNKDKKQIMDKRVETDFRKVNLKRSSIVKGKNARQLKLRGNR